MKIKLMVMSAVCALGFSSNAAFAAGCLKGAAVGGVAGHVAGKHSVLGAAGGCLVGRHMANKKAKTQANQASQPKPVAPARTD